MKPRFDRTAFLCLLVILASVLSACSPALPRDMSPFAEKLAWGMTPEEAAAALDMDLAAAMEAGTAGANLGGMTVRTEISGILGKKVPAVLGISYAPQGLHSVRYIYSMDDLDAVKAALEKVYGPGRMTAYFDMAGQVIHSEKDPDDYATDFEPAIYRWDSEKTLGDRPDVIAFFDDPAQTGFPRELGYAAWAGEGQRSIELRLREGEDGQELHLVQSAEKEGYIRVYDDWRARGEDFPAYYAAITGAWKDTWCK